MIKLSVFILLQHNFFLNAIGLTKFVIKLFKNVVLHILIFLIDIKLKKRVTESFIKIGLGYL